MTKVLEELDLGDKAKMLSARAPMDAEYISMLSELTSIGTVIVDDFHRLEDHTNAAVADLLKVTAIAKTRIANPSLSASMRQAVDYAQ